MRNINRQVAATVSVVFLAVMPSSSFGQAQTVAEPKMTLRSVMQELGVEFLRLTNSLLLDDFDGVEASAKAVEGHPLPAEIVAGIKGKLGDQFHAFEAVDEQSHQAAAELANRAVAHDPVGSAKAFGRLAEGGVACHQHFRATLRPLSDQ